MDAYVEGDTRIVLAQSRISGVLHANLLIRALPDDVHRALKRRASMHGRSLQREVQSILADAVGEALNATVALPTLHVRTRRKAMGERLRHKVAVTEHWCSPLCESGTPAPACRSPSRRCSCTRHHAGMSCRVPGSVAVTSNTSPAASLLIRSCTRMTGSGQSRPRASRLWLALTGPHARPGSAR